MGIRTPGLVIANDALYQLSYTPQFFAGVRLTASETFSTNGPVFQDFVSAILPARADIIFT